MRETVKRRDKDNCLFIARTTISYSLNCKEKYFESCTNRFLEIPTPYKRFPVYIYYNSGDKFCTHISIWNRFQFQNVDAWVIYNSNWIAYLLCWLRNSSRKTINKTFDLAKLWHFTCRPKPIERFHWNAIIAHFMTGNSVDQQQQKLPTDYQRKRERERLDG